MLYILPKDIRGDTDVREFDAIHILQVQFQCEEIFERFLVFWNSVIEEALIYYLGVFWLKMQQNAENLFWSGKTLTVLMADVQKCK